jgi:exodeoxyribonuclease V beta subunit
LILWFLGRDADGKPVGKVKARERIARATAAEVAQLLNLAAQGQAHIGSRPLDGGDIAVLVRTHREGRLVRDALMRLGIASVQQGQDNVFASHEAGELERVLMAIAEPALEAWVSSALATDMLGVPGEALYALREDEQAWEARLETFQDYHRLWRERGFIVMFRALLKREHVALRLLGYRDGERRLTNLLHLSELCQTAANRQRLSIAGLLKWFCEHRQGTDAEDEEVLLRLESDEHLVKIVTMHKSKGLEYPIVFCPFLWDGRLRSEKAAAFTFHDAAEGYQAVLELGSDPHNMRAHACREELAEGLRLAYVALTRAKYRCYLVWGAINEANTSPLAWLLHAPDVLPRDLTGDLAGDLTGDLIGDPITALAEHLSARPDHDLRQDLERLAHGADGAIRVLPLPADEAVPYSPPSPAREALSARQLRQPVPPGWRIASFSLLARGHSPELPDHDADSTGTALAAVSDILAFPRGPRAGRCLHAVFERLDFSRATRTDYEALADKVLREHGFGNEWVTAVSDMVERVLACPLDATGRLHLADISADRRLTELEFYYPIAHLDPRGLRGLLRRHGRSLPAPWRESIETLTFAPTQGFMKGFIDLVFEHGGRYYLVDYKSNWLGPERTAYRTERLAEVMVQEGYPLQYLIYTVALHRHLRLRLRGYRYDTHFGGVFYLFLRGMDPALGPDIGIYRDSPPAALIDALDRYLATGNLHDLARA